MAVLQLSGKDIDGDAVCCTGQQLANVLDWLVTDSGVKGCSWYAGAIECHPGFGDFEGPVPERVATPVELITRLRTVGQLLDGIFVVTPHGEAPIVRATRLTADGPMEQLVGNAVVELHAFDTSWIEVYSSSPTVLAGLQDFFGGTLRGTRDQGTQYRSPALASQ
jgi:hypothetical protein